MSTTPGAEPLERTMESFVNAEHFEELYAPGARGGVACIAHLAVDTPERDVYEAVSASATAVARLQMEARCARHDGQYLGFTNMVTARAAYECAHPGQLTDNVLQPLSQPYPLSSHSCLPRRFAFFLPVRACDPTWPMMPGSFAGRLSDTWILSGKHGTSRKNCEPNGNACFTHRA